MNNMYHLCAINLAMARVNIIQDGNQFKIIVIELTELFITHDEKLLYLLSGQSKRVRN